MAKKSDEAASGSDQGPEPIEQAPVEQAPVVDAGHYEGRQLYPKALYGKYPDGTVVAQKVEDAADHARLLAESPELGWAESPAEHGLETAPAGAPVESVKHAGIVGKV